MLFPVVMVCGSRTLPVAAIPRVERLVTALLGAGSVIVAGCATGADEMAVSAVLGSAQASRLRLFVIGAASGAGFSASVSALAGIRSAVAAGASVTWWAGGSAAVPLRARLVRRSQAGIKATAAGGAGSGLVAFVSALPAGSLGSDAWPSCGSGSWSSAAFAARLGLAVFLVPVGSLVGVSVASLPALAGVGYWASVGSGVLSGGFRWVSEPSLFAG